MRRRIRRSGKPDPVRLVLNQLERRESPSESLSFLSSQMFYGVATAQAAKALTRPAASKTAEPAIDIGIPPKVINWRLIGLSPPADTGVTSAPAPASAATIASIPLGTSWGDPWGGWIDEDLAAQGVKPTSPSANPDTPPSGGGNPSNATAPPVKTNETNGGGSGGTITTTPPQDPGYAPSAPVASARHASLLVGGGGGGSGSPFPWAVTPDAPGGGGGLGADVAFGSGTTVFTPATLLYPSSYVIDANKGAVLSESVINNDFSNWAVDLRAQVSGATVGTYTWDTTGAADATSISGASTYRLQFTWANFSGTHTDAITLTEDFVLGGSQSQTFNFLVAGTDSPAWSAEPTVVNSGTTVITPDMMQAGAASVSGPHHTITLADGSVSTSIALPSYNPSVPALSLTYNSLAADARPIFLVNYQLDPNPSDGQPSTLAIQLTVNGTALSTFTYDTSTMNCGDFVQVALQDNATGLSTGRYTYSIDAVETTASSTTIGYMKSGSFDVINDDASPFGAGWWVDGLDRIVTSSGDVELVMSGGLSLFFANAGGGTYTSPAGDFSTLVQNGGGTWTRTLADGSVEQFDTSGREVSLADTNGNTTTYTYSSGLLSAVTDPYGQTSTFAYDGSNKLASVTDPAGRVTDFTVSSGDLTAATDPSGAAWAYAYDAASRMTGITDPDKWTTTFAYDASANRASTVDEADGGTETVQPLQVQGLPTGGTTTAVLLAAVTADFTDGNSHTTDQRLDWNGYGQNMQTTDAAGDVSVQYRYSDGLLWLDADGLGRRTDYHYGSDGLTTPVYDVGQNVSRQILPDDTHDDYTYNGFGEVLTATNPIGDTTTYTYDAYGNQLTVTDALNETTTSSYDAHGNLLKTASPDLSPSNEALVNSGYTTNIQAYPKVAADSNGDYVVVWQSYGQDTSGYGIYAQRYNSLGVAQGTAFLVNSGAGNTSGNQTNPAVAMDASGDFVVAWGSDGQDGNGYGVYAKKYNSSGTVLVSEFLVNSYTTGNQWKPAVAMDAAGDFVVAWSSYGQDGSGYGIYAQLYHASGTTHGTEIHVSSHTSGNQIEASVGMDASGDFVVTWASYGQDGSGYGIYAQRYNSSGTAQLSEFRVNTHTTDYQITPSIALDSTGDFVVAWASYQDGSSYGIYAQRYNSSGATLGSEFPVNTYTTSTQSTPSVAMDSAGDFVVAWQSYGQDASGGYGVYAQRFSASGTALNSEFPVNTYTTSDQLSPAVAVGAGGDIVAAWGGQSAADTYYGITNRIVHVTAVTQYTYDAKSRLTATTDADGNTSSISYDSAGNVVTTTDPLNNVTTNTYDAMGRVLSTTLPDNDGNPANNPVWNYAYDGLGQLVSQTDPLGNTTDMAYDARGNSIRTNTPITLTPSSEAQPNSYTTGTQARPKVASDANGDYVVVWQSSGQDGSGYGIYAQMYNSYGVAQSTPFLVNSGPGNTSGDQTYPSVAMDSAGDFVIAWDSNGQDGSGYGVYAKKYSASGAVQVNEFLVNNTYTAGKQWIPSVAMDASGDFVIAWTSYGQDGSGYGVYAQQYNAAGTGSGEFRVNSHTANEQWLNAVAMDAAGDFVVVWSSQGQDGSGYGVYAQRYNAAGSTQGGEFPVNTHTAGNQWAESVAMDAKGDFVVAWSSYGQDASGGYGVYAQRFNAAGSTQGGEFPVNTYTTGNQWLPSVAMDAGGDFAIAWMSNGQDGSGYGVYAQRYNAAGTVQGGEYPLNNYTTGDQAAPALAMDASGDVVAAWEGQSATDTAGITTKRLQVTAETLNSYDPAGNLVTQTDPLERVTTFTYDNANYLVSQTNPANETNTYSYDAAHQVTAVTDALARPTTYTYNPRGQVLTVESPDQMTVAYGYCNCGCLASVTYYTASLASVLYAEDYTLDALGRQTSVTINGTTTSYLYDAAGNVASVEDGNTNVTKYAYNGLGQVISTTDPLGDVTLNAYDGNGNLTSTTDPNGNVTDYTYDAQNRLSKTVDPLSHTTSITYYNVDGQLATLTDADFNTTTYGYDVAGNLVTTTDPSGKVTTSSYDAAGQLTSTVDRDGRVINYTYDGAGRELTETWKPTTTTTTVDNIVTYTYAADGQMTKAQDFNSTYNYAYDATTGLLNTLDDNGSPSLPQLTLTYGYTSGQLDRINDSQNGQIDYLYNTAMQLTNIGLSISGVGAGAQVSMSYDAGGRLSDLDRTVGTVASYTLDTSYGYDAADRLTSIANVSSHVGTLSHFTYAYDQASQVVGYTGPEGGRAYAYDSDGELTTVTNTAGMGTVLESFTYDATGNRTSADGVTYGTAGPGNEMTSDGVYSYTYDNEGNLTVKYKSGDRWQYTYDEKNQLIEATELTGIGGSVIYDAKYTYDMFGRRIGIKENGTQTLWTFYDGDNAYADFNGSGTMTYRYLNGFGMDERYARQAVSGAAVAWYITDNLGSVRELAQNDGTVLDTITYSAFGTPTDSNAGAGDRFKYTGREWDAGTGQYYYRARYYAPGVGRFTSQDPMGFAAGDADLYRYVGNQPTSILDPSGLESNEVELQTDHHLGDRLRDLESQVKSFQIPAPRIAHLQNLIDQAGNNPLALQILGFFIQTEVLRLESFLTSAQGLKKDVEKRIAEAKATLAAQEKELEEARKGRWIIMAYCVPVVIYDNGSEALEKEVTFTRSRIKYLNGILDQIEKLIKDLEKQIEALEGLLDVIDKKLNP